MSQIQRSILAVCMVWISYFIVDDPKMYIGIILMIWANNLAR